MKKYILEIVIDEENDEYWEELNASGNTGCDIVLANIKDELEIYNAKVKLIRFTDD